MQRIIAAAIVGVGLCVGGAAFAQDVPAGVVMFNAANAKWVGTAGTPGGGMGAGAESASIIGDPAKPGSYVYVTRPAPAQLGHGPSSRPHTHPDTRTYQVI